MDHATRKEPSPVDKVSRRDQIRDFPHAARRSSGNMTYRNISTTGFGPKLTYSPSHVSLSSVLVLLLQSAILVFTRPHHPIFPPPLVNFADLSTTSTSDLPGSIALELSAAAHLPATSRPRSVPRATATTSRTKAAADTANIHLLPHHRLLPTPRPSSLRL